MSYTVGFLPMRERCASFFFVYLMCVSLWISKKRSYAASRSLTACLATLFETVFSHAYSGVFFICVNSLRRSKPPMRLLPFRNASISLASAQL